MAETAGSSPSVTMRGAPPANGAVQIATFGCSTEDAGIGGEIALRRPVRVMVTAAYPDEPFAGGIEA